MKPYAPRDGDKHQARHRINDLVKSGQIPRPDALPCADCGLRAKEYDHVRGYGVDHHEDVEAVCQRCHAARHVLRPPTPPSPARPGAAPIVHGTLNAYHNRDCRCKACKKANTDDCRARRDRNWKYVEDPSGRVTLLTLKQMARRDRLAERDRLESND